MLNKQTTTASKRKLTVAARNFETTVYAARDLAYEIASVNNIISDELIDEINDFLNVDDYRSVDYVEWFRKYYYDTVKLGDDVSIKDCQELLSENLMVDVTSKLKKQLLTVNQIKLSIHDAGFLAASYLLDEMSRPDLVEVDKLAENIRDRFTDDESTDFPLAVIEDAKDYCKFELDLQFEERLEFAASYIIDAIVRFNVTDEELPSVLAQVNKYKK